MGLSTTAVFERIRKLEREQVISEYVALVNKEAVSRSFVVFCHVRLVQHTKDNVLRFERQIQQLEEVQECHHISGDYDYVLKIYVKDMEEYREFMVNKLTTIKHIGSTQSSFMIGEVKNSAKINI